MSDTDELKKLASLAYQNGDHETALAALRKLDQLQPEPVSKSNSLPAIVKELNPTNWLSPDKALRPDIQDKNPQDTQKQAAEMALNFMPLSAGPKTVAAIFPSLGKGIANLIGGIETHTGGESLSQATRAGFKGGDTQKSFIDNLREKVAKTDVLNAVKQNIAEMGKAKSAEYKSGMKEVSKDKTILSFDGIDNALQNMSDAVSFKGQVKNKNAAVIGNEIVEEIGKWKNLDPEVFHTPEGLDALKQRIGGIVESIPYEEKTARMVGNNVYNAIKNEITKQAPVYADTMKGYHDASDQIKEIEKAFSQGDKSSADTGMRKLQSLMRNNVNTNYGNRLELAKKMEQAGGTEIMPALAGQALSSWTPRGMGNVIASATGAGGLVTMNPLAIPALAIQSPRLMGETALKIGQAARYAGKITNPPPTAKMRALAAILSNRNQND